MSFPAIFSTMYAAIYRAFDLAITLLLESKFRGAFVWFAQNVIPNFFDFFYAAV
ncbi:hypothetical protein [Bartonella sp. F02]|uniref:hypothetical protein n=1 Tax=Bartonella sp. F02 TaxID=2967262 RepID=UPI0022A8F23B|nr:hypothetical protein [Bartonella sp. F02]MCZ2327860.1 hypothetical protein [Bartonella sp. F02]